MKTFLYIGVIIILAGIIGCSQEPEHNPSFPVSVDLLQELRDNIQQEPLETFFIDFRNGGHPEQYLKRGWSAPEQEYTWATSEKSSLLFYSYETQQDLMVEIICQAIPSEDTGPQLTIVSVNDTQIASFVPEPFVLKTFIVTVPVSSLNFGENLLHFRFAYTTKPVHLDSQSQDKRNLSVAFQKITFKQTNAAIHLQDPDLLQDAGATMRAVLKLPQQFELEAHYRSIHRAVPKIQLVNDEHGRIELELSPKKKSYRKTIELAKDGIYRLIVTAEGAPDSQIAWDHFQINLPSSHVEISPSPRAQHSLNQYDVIYVVFDAFHAKHSSVYDYSRKTTPFLEKLAQEAVVFENMFANAPYTLASVGTLFTSLYPYEHGLVHITRALGPLTPTINEVLSSADIATYLITEHGYLTKNEHRHRGKDWGLYRGFSQVFHNLLYSKNFHQITETLDDIYTSNVNKRKFIYIHFLPPHSPYNPPEEFRKFILKPEPDFVEPTTIEVLREIDSGEVDIDDRQVEYIKSYYDSYLLFVDHIAEQLYNHLTNRGIIDQSILIFTSDHGEAFMQHGRILHTTTVFDEMLHVPFIIRFPKEVAVSSERIHHLASLLDIAPTLADIYNIKEQPVFSGKSLLPAIFDNVSINTFIYSETFSFSATRRTRLQAIRDLNYKYIFSPQKQMLFNIAEDPLEQHDIVKELPITASYYRQLMRPFSVQQFTDSPHNKVDIDDLDEEMIQKLKELGYIK